MRLWITFAADVADVVLQVLCLDMLVPRRFEREFFVTVIARKVLFLLADMYRMEVLPQSVNGIKAVPDVASVDSAIVLVVYL